MASSKYPNLWLPPFSAEPCETDSLAGASHFDTLPVNIVEQRLVRAIEAVFINERARDHHVELQANAGDNSPGAVTIFTRRSP